MPASVPHQLHRPGLVPIPVEVVHGQSHPGQGSAPSPWYRGCEPEVVHVHLLVRRLLVVQPLERRDGGKDPKDPILTPGF